MPRPTARSLVFSGALCLALASGGPRLAWAQTPDEAALDTGAAVELGAEEARRADALVNNFMSPFCPGRTLAGCPSPAAGLWRQEIRRWVRDGASNVEIEQRLAQRAPGFNLAGNPSSPIGRWLAVLLAVGAIAFLVFVLRRMVKNQVLTREETGTGATAPKPSTPDDDKLDTRLDRELEAFE